MAFRMSSPPSSARLAIAGIALCMGLTYSQTVSAQCSKYGSPFDSYGGYCKPYKQYPYKQYDPYKE